MYNQKHIRNFAIIAHIDHGKSTLADRLIQACGGLTAREMKEQVLDSMELERERGITIKAQTVRLAYKAKDGETYVLNLMDTPGHVDFAYEVSRSLAACEGSLLVVDATQGVEAQTLANVYQAIDNNHEIVPILNKIDLPAAEPDKVKQQIEDVIGLDASDALEISAKTGLGIPDVLEALVTRLPAPTGDATLPLQALLIDSWYDQYLGVIILVRVKQGRLAAGMKIRMLATGAAHDVDQTGVFTPKHEKVAELAAGRGRVPDRRHQGSGRLPDRRHDHRGASAGRGAAGVQAQRAGGLLRPVSRRRGRFRAAARESRQAAAERCQLPFRAGELSGTGLRFSLRIPGPACIWKSSRSGWSASSISI